MINSASEKILIGLTGSIASGKSTALACFQKLGAGILSADELVRKLYQKTFVRKQVTAWFGTTEPAQIARRVFQDETARKQLENFLHPLVWKEMQTQLKKFSARCVVLELPLLFEAGWEKKVDLTLLICGSKKSQKERLQARGMSTGEYRKRLQAQLPETEKIQRADICIVNDKTPQDLEVKITQLYNALKQIYQF